MVTDLGGQSCWVDLDGPVHYLDFAGPARGPTIVCVHGLGGAAVNWSAVAPLLAGRCRILAPDLAGHGLTQSAGRGTGVAPNRALLHRFIDAVPGAPVILMGNSMGGMIALLEASAAAGAVAGVILIDPVLPFALAWPDPLIVAWFALYLMPGVGRRMMARYRRVPPEVLVAGMLSRCCVDATRVPADIVALQVAVARRRTSFPGFEQDFAAAMRSVTASVANIRGTAYRQAIRTVRCPVLLVHGARDRIVPIAVARAAARANPSWSLVVIPHVGHVPQLEAPGDTAEAVASWLDASGRSAAGSAFPQRRPDVAAAGAPPLGSVEEQRQPGEN